MRLVVAVTGVSGAVLGIGLLERPRDAIAARVLDQFRVAVPGTPRWAGAEPVPDLVQQAGVY